MHVMNMLNVSTVKVHFFVFVMLDTPVMAKCALMLMNVPVEVMYVMMLAPDVTIIEVAMTVDVSKGSVVTALPVRIGMSAIRCSIDVQRVKPV